MKCNALAREEEVRRFQFRHIKSAKSPDRPVLGSNSEMRDAFQAHFHDRFVLYLDLSVQEFWSYLADFPCPWETEVASCEVLVTEFEVRDTLKHVDLNKSSWLDGLLYKVYLRLLHMFVPILTDNLHLVREIIDGLKDGTEVALINLDQSQAFDRVDHRFLATVLEIAGFKAEFREWINMMFHNLQAVVQVNGKPMSRSLCFAIWT